MKVLLTLALAVGLMIFGGPAGIAQSIDVNRDRIVNGWYPDRSAAAAERELVGAPTGSKLRYPPSQARTVTIVPGAGQVDGVRVTRSGSTRVEQPIVAAAAPAKTSQARVLRVQPKTRYGTVVVVDPDAFRPAKRD